MSSVPKRAPIHAEVAGNSSHYIHVPSPSVAPRALTPGPVLPYREPYTLAPEHLDSLRSQIREDVWRDASGMINEVISGQMVDVLAENSALKGRVEQLEVHSDNLAQWIQHLNRVQDDLTASLRSLTAAREEILIDEPSLKYGHSSSSHPSRVVASGREQQTYAPAYPIGTASTHSSPKRNFSVRHSPSPVMVHHSTSIPSASRRNPTLPPSTSSSHPYDPRGTPTYRDHPRDVREPQYISDDRGHRVVSSDYYERPYHTYPSDDRDPHPPTLPLSPRLPKRARNGY
jgi:hypothetical protein